MFSVGRCDNEDTVREKGEIRKIIRAESVRMRTGAFYCFVIGALLTMAVLALWNSNSVAMAVPSVDASADCTSCHSVDLKTHSVLGSGTQACRECHANANMSALQLEDGTEVALADSPQLCAMCHKARYDAWATGTHGFPGFKEGRPTDGSEVETTCTTCHNPHSPRLAFDITKPHPEPAPGPMDPPRDVLMIFAISLVTVSGAFLVTLAGRGRA